MRRTELEAKLAARGWYNTGRASGSNHTIWTHPTRKNVIVVRHNLDLIHDAMADRILAEAGEE